MKTNATWLSFSGTRLSGTPSISDIGNYWVNISVSDGLHTAAANFTITVKTRQAPPPPNNTSPKIDSTSVDNYRNNVSVNNSEIIIKFSKPMNRSSVESALSVSTNVEYTLEWNNDSTELKIIFKDKLDYNTTYNITIDPTAKDIYGNYLSSPFKLFFTTEAESNLDGNEGKPDNDFKPEENVGVLALIIIILLLIIVLMVFAVFVLSRRNKKMEPQSDPKDLESRIVPASDSASGSIADEFDFESSSSKESDEYVMKLLNEARAAKKPSDFDIRKEEMLYKIERKYSKGEISKNTYNSIRDLLEDYKIY